jgi:hypothetical protein
MPASGAGKIQYPKNDTIEVRAVKNGLPRYRGIDGTG